ncbi:DUF6455 family protein [Aestuariivita sp.]|jgi:hypothetical protein|uniref:DUF6455 family protein n=1 Tax=Aestuariivita sp. TaxID=1872407 RepID=UPI00217498C4|nr:DUF6455 family protein [Aestuariivita sp.]MCE8008685.1 hypothetical protein [Aestuariivita sp.]
MAVLDGVDAHFWLTRSVARVAGVNLSGAMARAALSPDQYAEMVARCEAAGCADRCADWLAQSPTATEPPPFCVHTAQLKALRRA